MTTTNIIEALRTVKALGIFSSTRNLMVLAQESISDEPELNAIAISGLTNLAPSF
jgi:hypothetical protein